MDDQPIEDTQPTEDKEDNKKPILPSLTSEDIKLLVITFAGTVAANLVTVLFVGLAIAIAHSFDLAGAPLGWIILVTFATVVSITTAVSLSVIFSRERNTEQKFFTGRYKKFWTTLGVYSAVAALMFVLMWIGIASGIK
jgi:hypothetical protein